MTLGCDGCVECCRLLGVPEIGKPRGHMCVHMQDGGCSLHPARAGGQPESCGLFLCVWLASQQHHNPAKRMAPTMRPDRCGVVMGPLDPEDSNKLYVNVDPDRPRAWLDPEVLHHLDRFVKQGTEVVLYVGDDAMTTLRLKDG